MIARMDGRQQGAMSTVKEIPLRGSTCEQPIQSMLAGFFETASRENIAAPAKSWGVKSGISVFDDEDVLAPPAGEQAGVEQIAVTLYVSQQALKRVVNVKEESALRSIKNSCFLYTLGESSGDTCPICLEALRAGEDVWRLPCWHQIHNACAVRYYRTRRVKPLCPMCRRDTRMRDDVEEPICNRSEAILTPPA
eukprot:CAMPEP_0115478244 /NCGR_PEP_ID=MMETSP0271-20121206/56100_1 /TAXON_ID=71861 /ORGANISM="Scrippsiella trochoidea, Strain CCMP3099" /LENGTH=193 /DNA_ID=CAMNT_0002905777 /DNA_START=81 /DNA_END=659 /DNA_ORIENTATION=-